MYCTNRRDISTIRTGQYVGSMVSGLSSISRSNNRPTQLKSDYVLPCSVGRHWEGVLVKGRQLARSFPLYQGTEYEYGSTRTLEVLRPSPRKLGRDTLPSEGCPTPLQYVTPVLPYNR